MKKFVILTLFLIISILAKSQKMEYITQWKQVDDLIEKEQPRSALKVVEQIYNLAKQENNQDQMLKSYLYKMALPAYYDEDNFTRVTSQMEADLKTMEEPNASILHSILARIYWQYYEYNSWEIDERTTISDTMPEDVKTWSTMNFIQKIVYHLNKSLAYKTILQNTPISIYHEMVSKGTADDQVCPTLYDLLSVEALNFYQYNTAGIIRPADYFEINSPVFFEDAQSFVNEKFTTEDTLSFQYNGIKVLQDWLKFRLSDTKNKEALVYADLKRLDFVQKNSVVKNDDELYEKALLNIIEKYPDVYQTTFAYEKLADSYYSLGQNFSYNDQSTYIYKDYLKKAIEYYQKIVEKFPNDSIVTPKAKNKINLIKREELQLTGFNTVLPSKNFPVSIEYKNISKVYVEIRKIDYDDYLKILKQYYETKRQEYQNLMKKSSRVKSYSFDLPKTDDYQTHSTELVLDKLQKGYYLIYLGDNQDIMNARVFAYQLFNVSDLTLISKQDSGFYEGYVVNSENSEPIANATVYLYKSKDYQNKKPQLVKKSKTDKQGFFKIALNKNHDYFIDISYGKDTVHSIDYFYYYKSGYSGYEDYKPEAKIITDRSIYRPGQTVYFKGILMSPRGEDRNVISDYDVNITIRDANYTEIFNKTYKTNDFGSFTGHFVIPKGLLNGTFYIQTEYGSVTFQVEEYKRPTFFVTVNAPMEQYLVNQDVVITGSAENYSGVKLNDATVKYSVSRKSRWIGWWWWHVPDESVQITDGEVTTDENGKFKFSFKAIPDLSMPEDPNTVFDYEITVDVTDLNGETQSQTISVSVGYAAMTVSTSIPSEIDISGDEKLDSIEIYAQNLNYQDVDAQGTIEIYSLNYPQYPFLAKKWNVPDKPIYTETEWNNLQTGFEYKKQSDFRYWKEKAVVWKLDFDTKKSKIFNAEKLKELPSGVYKVVITTKDKFGNEVKKEQFVEIYDRNSNKIPFPENNFVKQINPKVEPGENAKFIIGSSFPTTFMVEVIRGDKILEQKFITLKKNEQKIFEFPVTEDYRGGFSVHFKHYVNGEAYENSFNVYVPYSNKKLKVEFATFRDNLLPGQKEQWKIYIKNPDGTPADAELLTFMYDASLDDILPYNLSFFPFSIYYSNPTWNMNEWKIQTRSQYSDDYQYYRYGAFVSPKINMFGLVFWYSPYFGYMETVVTGYGRKKKFAKVRSMFASSKAESAPLMEADDEELDNVRVAEGIARTQKPLEPTPKKVQIRKNFNETAFFYPQLVTDSTGQIIVSFTVPESLTKWHIWGLATTPDLKFNLFQKYLKTQKKLMVMPNAPRFFRQGDTLFFSTKVSNLTDNELTGTVSLEFIDDITEKQVGDILLDNQNKTFTAKPQQSTVVTWKIAIPDDAQILTYRVIARSGDFSDGEQKTLPVMTNYILVTEALPLPVRPLQKKTFKFQKLLDSKESKTLKNYNLSVEFTSNPAWYAVQALPYLAQYPYDCNEQTFAKLYANTLASYIANSSPKIKAVFDRWKNYEPDALMSNLEKNQELKSALLEETPWVLDAKSEEQQKRNIALLFDFNRMANERETAIRKLKKNQMANGGWSWFKGMQASVWVTQYIVEGTGHLLKLGVIDKKDELYRMSIKALNFIDAKMQEDYEYIDKHYTKKEKENYQTSTLLVHYFYARSFYDVPVPKKYQKAYDYFYKHMVDHIHDYPLYTQAIITLILLEKGENPKLVQEMIKSFKERAVYDEEMGMYWKSNVAGYYWYQNPIQTQTIMIELFDRVGDTATVEELKIWLLKNKQTNRWNSTVSTAEAIYALLLTSGTDLLAESDIIPVQLGDTLIDPNTNPNIKTESGTGYYKVNFAANEIKPQMGKITVNNTNKVVTWGAVYWQYFESIDKITGHQTNLQIHKELYKEITDATGKKLQKITPDKPLEVGDIVVVRLVIETDRDMEYVHIKDMRASGFEPVDVISGYTWQGGIGFYRETKDASTNFFVDYLPKGTYVLEYRVKANNAGSFSNGMTTIQCMYAPEFASHSKGMRVRIN